MVLDARIGAGPGGVTDIFPQIARLDRLGDTAIGAVQKRPIGIVFDRLQEGIGDADRVVGVLPRDRRIGFTVPIRVICRKLDAVIALLGVIQHAFHIGLGDR